MEKSLLACRNAFQGVVQDGSGITKRHWSVILPSCAKWLYVELEMIQGGNSGRRRKRSIPAELSHSKKARTSSPEGSLQQVTQANGTTATLFTHATAGFKCRTDARDRKVVEKLMRPHFDFLGQQFRNIYNVQLYNKFYKKRKANPHEKTKDKRILYFHRYGEEKPFQWLITSCQKENMFTHPGTALVFFSLWMRFVAGMNQRLFKNAKGEQKSSDVHKRNKHFAAKLIGMYGLIYGGGGYTTSKSPCFGLPTGDIEKEKQALAARFTTQHDVYQKAMEIVRPMFVSARGLFHDFCMEDILGGRLGSWLKRNRNLARKGMWNEHHRKTEVTDKYGTGEGIHINHLSALHCLDATPLSCNPCNDKINDKEKNALTLEPPLYQNFDECCTKEIVHLIPYTSVLQSDGTWIDVNHNMWYGKYSKKESLQPKPYIHATEPSSYKWTLGDTHKVSFIGGPNGGSYGDSDSSSDDEEEERQGSDSAAEGIQPRRGGNDEVSTGDIGRLDSGSETETENDDDY